MLLYGPPGCSKTLMARALATAAQANFIAVKVGSTIYTRMVLGTCVMKDTELTAGWGFIIHDIHTAGTRHSCGEGGSCAFMGAAQYIDGWCNAA